MNDSVSLLAVRLTEALASRMADGLSIIVVDGEQRAESLTRLMRQLAPGRKSLHLPAWDCLPYDRAPPSPDLMGQRMRALADALAHPDALLVTTPDAAVQRFLPLDALPRPTVLKVGAAFDGAAFAATCEAFGYKRADRVDDPGHVAIRGEVVDIYPAVPRPYRINLEDGRIAALHRYDPVTQRTISAVAAVRIDPVSEVVTPGAEPCRFDGVEHWWPEVYDGSATIFDLAPSMVMVEAAAGGRFEALFAGIADAHRDRLTADDADGQSERRILPPKRLYLSEAEWAEALAKVEGASPPYDGAGEVPRFCLMDKPGQAFEAYVEEALAGGRRVVVTGAREQELALLAKQIDRITGCPPVRAEGWSELPPPGSPVIGLLRLSADHGFVDEEAETVLITAADLLGHHARALSTRAVPVPWHLGDGDFATGDFVIHLDHGVGVLKGLETIRSGGDGSYDVVRLGYAADADLLVPVETLDRVWRYGGPSSEAIVDRLEGQAWPKRQARIARDVRAAAGRLFAMARQRRDMAVPKIVPPRRAYEQFVAGFAFAPTADQMHAIDDCLRGLASGRPMDRLVVGDVGFGKTEVALRAAAAAALAGYQVALVAPTTVLAHQHFQCFRRRFEQLGLEVGQLSRLASPDENERVRAGLVSGDLRVVVGTQALCGPDIAFQKLGLVIVDEEQRFGTADKERVRARGLGAHLLTLTATPIPRTLQSALVGLQDLSVIATPPARRRPIRTRVAPFDTVAVRTALLKEKARGGQSFVVVPRIEDLKPFAATLRGLVPGLDVRMAHGGLDADDIDAVMTGFEAGGGDVLLATSIIESGLDVPRANTMIICRADRFGLAELHQLRGRVGRGQQQGVCLLMTAPDQPVAPATEHRLATLARFDRLGSGMAISAEDLDARGGGDLTGDEQTGHSHLIGLGLYQHLLQRALREMSDPDTEEWSPELHLGDGGALPPDYIPEPDLRINLYARIARATETHDLDLLAEEIDDRFGPMPDAVATLMARARLKCLCRSRRVARIDAGPRAIAFTPRRGTEPEVLLEGASSQERAACRVKQGRVLLAVSGAVPASDTIHLSAHFLHDLA